MVHDYEAQMRYEARCLGFSISRNHSPDGGPLDTFAIIDRSGNGIIRASPVTLDEMAETLEQIAEADRKQGA